MAKEGLSAQAVGRLGELAIEQELLKRGWIVGNFNAAMANTVAYDLFAVKNKRRIYAVFEAKQTLTATHVQYAKDKVASVRKLFRTSLPIPHAGGTYSPKPLTYILGGILTFESEWTPPLGDTLITNLKPKTIEETLDIGCVAAHGLFTCDEKGSHSVLPQSKPATALLLELIARLQSLGTVAMIDTRAYAQWLAK